MFITDHGLTNLLPYPSAGQLQHVLKHRIETVCTNKIDSRSHTVQLAFPN